jgi:hypothetical protein
MKTTIEVLNHSPVPLVPFEQLKFTPSRNYLVYVGVMEHGAGLRWM